MNERLEAAERPPIGPRGTWLGATAPHLVVFVAAFSLLLNALGTPRILTADEVDTLRGGRQVVDLLTTDDQDPRLAWGPSLRGRLRAGFVPNESPRVAQLPDSAPRRAVVEAPVPQWLAALGIGVLPSSSEASNLGRARVASALALALALALLTFGRRCCGPLQLGFIAAAAFALPGFLDAGASAGYAAASLLTMAIFLVLTERLLERGRGSVWVGLAIGLCLGVHPFHLVLLAVVFVAWAVRRRPVLPAESERPGLVRLPAAPLGLFAIPVVALVALVLVWPALWNDTGNRLGAWILDLGSLRSPPSEVAGLAWDQAGHRTSQAWTALWQWVALTPWPLLLLWGVGFGRAIRAGRDGRWLPIVTLFALVLVAGLDGGLFGGRLSLAEALWAPTLWTAADGFEAAVAWVRARLVGRASGLAQGPALAWGLGLVALLWPILSASRDAAHPAQLGLEARFGLPMALLNYAEQLAPDASVHVRPMPEQYRPTLDALRNDLESGLDWGSEQAGLLLTLGEAPADLAPRLSGPLARLGSFGRGAALWRLEAAPAPAPGP